MTETIKKPTLKDWFFATRPWSFPVSSLPALVAMLYAIYAHPECYSQWILGVVAVVGAVIFHAGGNLISDYHDYQSGVDKEGIVGTDMLTSGLFSPRQILVYGWTFIIIGVALGLFLVVQSGAGLLWIGLFGAAAAVFYYFLKFRALGDLLIFLVYGSTIMLGTAYVMLRHFDWLMLFVSFPMAFITVSVLHSNNTRDMKSDRHAGIRTFAMVIGLKASQIYYYLLNALAYVGIIVMVALNILPLLALIILITLPVAFKNGKAMSQATENDLRSINDLDIKTAQLQLMFSLTLSLALLIAIML